MKPSISDGMRRAPMLFCSVALLGISVMAANAVDTNVWKAAEAGNASSAENWSLGAPTASQVILLDTNSAAAMTWDFDGVNGLPDTVAGWIQTADYTGTVTFPVVYSGAFTNFTVTGDVLVDGGKWTHTANDAAQVYRLRSTIGGDLSIGSSGSINVRYMGYAQGKYPSGGQLGVHGGARGDFTKVYGNVYAPEDIGAGGANYAGGGAVWLEVVGAVEVNGTITANSYETTNGYDDGSSGAGGSIYIRGSSLSGSGKITASASQGTDSGYGASGGRIAIVLTEATTLGFSANSILAYGGNGGATGRSAAAGTVLVKTAVQTYGTLYVNKAARINIHGVANPTTTGTTCVKPGEIWAFDAIVTKGAGVLSIPDGATLKLPNGLAGVSSADTTRQNGILYLGGDLDLGETPDWTFENNWVFQVDHPLAITGNVAVVNGGSIGCMPFCNTVGAYAKTDLTVVGDMTVDASSYLWARGAGIEFDDTLKCRHGGQVGGSTRLAYDSVFNPLLPGGSGGNSQYRYPGGGAILLTVTGNLVLDGKINASGYDTSSAWGVNSGGGGTINIRAGSLSGAGSLLAHVGNATKNNGGAGPSGGGRIAVRLTDAGADFSGFDTGYAKVKAHGISWYYSSSTLRNTTDYASEMSSAGTIYLQSGNEPEGSGRIIVANDNSTVNNVAVTPLPSGSYGGDADVFDAASLTIERCGRVKLFKALKMAQLDIETNSVLDLNGFVFRVRRMTAGGVDAASGTYANGSSVFTEGFVTDSLGGGSLVVTGLLTLITIR